MSSALKQPVIAGTANQSPNAPTAPSNVTSQIGLNKNIQQVTANLPLNSATQNKALSTTGGNLPSLGNSAPASVKPFSQTPPSVIPSQPTYPSLLSHSQNLHSSNQQPNATTSASQQPTAQNAVTGNQAQQSPSDGPTPSVQHTNKQLNSSSSIGGGGSLSGNASSQDASKVSSQGSQITPTPVVSSSPQTQTTSSASSTGTTANASTPAVIQQKNVGHSTVSPPSVTANTSSNTSPVKSAVQSNGAVESPSAKPIVSNAKEEQITTTVASADHSKVDTSKKEATNDTKVESAKEVTKENEKVSPSKPAAAVAVSSAPTSVSSVETSKSVMSSSAGTTTVPPNTKPPTQVQTPDSIVSSAVQNSSSSSSLSQSPVQNATTVSPKVENQKTPTRTVTTSSVTTPTSKAATAQPPTTPRSATKRKRESMSKVSETPPKAAKLENVATSTPRSQKSSMAMVKSDENQKGKRVRVPTQPYQSPLPEMTIISKIGSRSKSTPNSDDKLIAFFKNEFLAVRNTEGGFYVCQAVQNVKKTSSKIRIRWLSNQDKTSNIYTPDFYDYTEFDCILTNLKLNKLEKGRFRLPKEELDRTENILKRALDVEQGVETEVSLTEEHPDGLDISLLTDENQVKKGKSKRSSPKAQKRKAGGKGGRSAKRVKTASKTKKIQEPAKSQKITEIKKIGVKTSGKSMKGKTAAAKSLTKKVDLKPQVLPSTSSMKKGPSSRSQRYQSRKANVGISGTSPVVDAKKAKVLAKVAGHKPTASTSRALVSVKPVKSVAKIKKAKATTAPVPSTSGRSGRHPTTTVPSITASTSSRRSTSGRRASKK